MVTAINPFECRHLAQRQNLQCQRRDQGKQKMLTQKQGHRVEEGEERLLKMISAVGHITTQNPNERCEMKIC